jgi:hypothetical protein
MKIKAGHDLQETVRILETLASNSDDLEIESPAYLIDVRTGQKREHDVLLSIHVHHQEMITAIECRDRSRPVGVPDIEQFAEKCRNTKVNKGVIVSSKGFRATALRLAESYGISCLNLDEVKSVEWLAARDFTVIWKETTNSKFQFCTKPPLPENGRVLNKDGTDVNKDILNELALELLSRIATPELPPMAHGEKDDSITLTQVIKIDDAKEFFIIIDNEIERELDYVIAEIEYKVLRRAVPFKIMIYRKYDGSQEILSFASMEWDIKDDNYRIDMYFYPEKGYAYIDRSRLSERFSSRFSAGTSSQPV